MTMLQNMVDDGLRTLCGNSMETIKEFFRNFAPLFAFFLCHWTVGYQRAIWLSLLRPARLSDAARAGDRYNDS